MDFEAIPWSRKYANTLLSPPTSPSGYAPSSELGEHGWHNIRLASPQVLPTPSASSTFSPVESTPHACDEKALVSQELRLRHRLSSPYPPSLSQTIKIENSKSMSSTLMAPELAQPEPLRREDPLKQSPARASSKNSPPTPQLVLKEVKHRSDKDELFGGSVEDSVAVRSEIPKSGAERLAEKRKMKRFRLTQAQTRYLTSEFSQQPHPDAAHREKLSRDIPGLNPRQVQVWFQNKRAKLKRLATDGQDRIRVSRVLPVDFDFSQNLPPPSTDLRPLYGSALTDPLMLGSGVSQRPSLRLGMGHLSTVSNSISLSFTSHLPSPISANGSADPSPVSSINKPSQPSSAYFSSTKSALAISAQYTNLLGHPHTLSSDQVALQRQSQNTGQNSMTGVGFQSIVTMSPPKASLATDTCDYGNLAPLQLSRTPHEPRENPRSARAQTTRCTSPANGSGLNHYLTSTKSTPSDLFYQKSQMIHPSGSAFRGSSYFQSQDTSFWQGIQMSPQGYQHGQQLLPHQTTEQRHGSESTQHSLAHDPLVQKR